MIARRYTNSTKIDTERKLFSIPTSDTYIYLFSNVSRILQYKGIGKIIENKTIDTLFCFVFSSSSYSDCIYNIIYDIMETKMLPEIQFGSDHETKTCSSESIYNTICRLNHLHDIVVARKSKLENEMIIGDEIRAWKRL